MAIVRSLCSTSHPISVITTRAKNRRPAPPTKSARDNLLCLSGAISLPVIQRRPRSPLSTVASGELKPKTANHSRLPRSDPCSRPCTSPEEYINAFGTDSGGGRLCFLCQQQLQPPQPPAPQPRRLPNRTLPSFTACPAQPHLSPPLLSNRLLPPTASCRRPNSRTNPHSNRPSGAVILKSSELGIEEPQPILQVWQNRAAISQLAKLNV